MLDDALFVERDEELRLPTHTNAEEFRSSFARAREAFQLFGHPRRQFFETPETCLAYLKFKPHVTLHNA